MHADGSDRRSDELAGEVGGLVMEVVAGITDQWAILLDQSFVTSTQVTLLRHLLVTGPASMGQVAHALHCDPSLATAAVDRLESRDLVRRVADETDRRIRRVDLTDAGSQLVRSIWTQMRAATPVGRLDDRQLTQLRTILKKMLEAPETDQVPPAETNPVVGAPEEQRRP